MISVRGTFPVSGTSLPEPAPRGQPLRASPWHPTSGSPRAPLITDYQISGVDRAVGSSRSSRGRPPAQSNPARSWPDEACLRSESTNGTAFRRSRAFNCTVELGVAYASGRSLEGFRQAYKWYSLAISIFLRRTMGGPVCIRQPSEINLTCDPGSDF
jgi:hypothetical protein